MLFQTTGPGIFRVQTDNPVWITLDLFPMFFNVDDMAAFTVHVCMKLYLGWAVTS